MSLILPGDPNSSLSSVTLSHGASRVVGASPTAASVLQQWWQLEADGWVKRGSHDISLLLNYHRLNRQNPEANRLVACLNFIEHIRRSMPTGIEEANNERVFHYLIQLIMRPSSESVLKARYDHVLEFSQQLKTPVIIEKYSQSYGEFSNSQAGLDVYQGRESKGVTAHELFIDPIADVLVRNSREAKLAGKAIVTNAEIPQEQWHHLRIPCADESGRMRSLLIARCIRSDGSDHSWMFKTQPK